MTDFNKILEKAKEIEAKMRESQNKLKKIEVNGTSGGDAIVVYLNGDGEMTKISLSDKVLKEEKEIIQDLICLLRVVPEPQVFCYQHHQQIRLLQSLLFVLL